MRDELILDTPERLRALAHPLRQTILRLLTNRPYTNKQLADATREQPAKVHFHLRELARAGLIELAEERPKGGVMEKYYRNAARNFRLNWSAEGFGLRRDEIVEASVAALRTATETLGASAESFGGPPPGTRVAQATARITRDDLAHLQALLDEIDEHVRRADEAAAAGGDIRLVALTYVLHALPPRENDPPTAVTTPKAEAEL